MALLTYEYHDLACDAVDGGKICGEFFTGTPGMPAALVRGKAREDGWVLAESTHTGQLKDYCPEHKARL